MNEYYSHPNRLLKTHLINVCKIGTNVFNKKNISFTFDKNDIFYTLKICLLCHDIGKGTSFFQERLQKGTRSKYTSHSLTSALITIFQIQNSIFFQDDNIREILSIISFCIIRKHHGNLENIDDLLCITEEDMEIVKQQYNSIDFSYFQSIFKEMDLIFYIPNSFIQISQYRDYLMFDALDTLEKYSNNFEIYILINFLYSILLTSDKGDCIFNINQKDIPFISDIRINSNIVDQYKKENFNSSTSSLSDIRNNIYYEVESNILNTDSRILSINAPTGTGKTITVLNAALKLREQKPEYKRIIYCLPFTSIIDQNYEVYYEILKCQFNKITSDLFLKHHHLSEIKYSLNNNDFDTNESEYLIEGWESELIVTTFYQMIYTLFSNKNSSLRKFHNISNSIIILDEIQSINFQYWLLINKFFIEISKLLNIKFILVTATLPLIFSEQKNEIYELLQSKNVYFNGLNRIKLDCTLLKKDISIEEFCEIVYNDINNNLNKSFLIVLNTIKSSIIVNNFLNDNNFETYYLSANIIPKTRKNIIEMIKNKKGQKIVVSTQLIEAGVDIDLDIVYRDISPLDSINQTAGRCNRESSKNNGTVKLVSLKDSNRKFSSYIYDSFLLSKTYNILKNENIIPENRIYNLSQKYYTDTYNDMSREISQNLINFIQKLNYKDAFFNKNTAIQLIPFDYKKNTLFIELDKKATKLWEEYCNIKEEKDFYLRKQRFNNIKKDFYEYIISVNDNIQDNDESIIMVSKEQLEHRYDNKTGYIKNDSMVDFFI